jgi:hypothetical protein
VALVDDFSLCDAWRRSALLRVLRIHPDLVVVGGATHVPYYTIVRHGRRLSRWASEPFLEAGFARTLRLLQSPGTRIVVIRDIAHAPADIRPCVAAHLRAPSVCAFAPRRSGVLDYPVRAAEQVGGVRIIDSLPRLCQRGVCPAVIGDILAYRNDYHLTATFARTLAGWLGAELDRPALVSTPRPFGLPSGLGDTLGPEPCRWCLPLTR